MAHRNLDKSLHDLHVILSQIASVHKQTPLRTCDASTQKVYVPLHQPTKFARHNGIFTLQTLALILYRTRKRHKKNVKTNERVQLKPLFLVDLDPRVPPGT
jgi:hypothetical protein